MTTGKAIALTRWTFVGRVMSLLFNMLSRLEKAVAPHSSTLAWKIPRAEEPGGLQSKWLGMTEHAYTYMGIAIVGFFLSLFLNI